MTTLALRLAGPLQAWGSRSRFVRRETERAPTKSGVIGLLAAARGVRRTDDLTEFFGLRFGVRIDQPGQVIRDFQTARSLDGERSMPLSYRYYLADAAFLAVIEGEAELLHGLAEALRQPVFPLFLGRRSCPPAGPLSFGIRDGSLAERLGTVPWQASEWYQRRDRREVIELESVVDTEPGDPRSETIRDEPLSFDPALRQYGWRSVVREPIPDVPRRFPSGRGEDAVPVPEHDPMSALGG